MKKNRFSLKKVCVNLLVILIILAVSACSGPGSSSNESSSTSNASSVESDSTNEVKHLDIFVNETWWLTDKWKGIIPDEITKRTGVALDLTIAADANQLGLMIASNELPDLVFTDTNIDRLSDSKLCYPLDDLSKENGLDFAATIGDERAKIANFFSKDDKIYTCLNAYASQKEWKNAAVGVPGQACIFYRKDMYQELGSPSMSNLDEFASVLESSLKKYPNIIPFACNINQKFTSIATEMGAGSPTEYIYDSNKKPTIAMTTPEYHNYLKYMNQLAQKKLISADNYVLTSEPEARAYAFGGKCFAFSWYTSPGFIDQLNNETRKVAPKAEWALLAPLNDKPYYNAGVGWAGLFISRNCKDPKAAINFVNFMYSEEGRHLSEWGREGTDYTLDERGVPKFSKDWVSLLADETAHIKKYNYCHYYGITAIDEAYQRYSNVPKATQDIFNKYKEKTVNVPELALGQPLSGSDEKVLLDKLTELGKSLEGSVIFSVNDEEFEKNYKNYMSKAEALGASKFNSWYAENVEKFRKEYGF